MATELNDLDLRRTVNNANWFWQKVRDASASSDIAAARKAFDDFDEVIKKLRDMLESGRPQA